MADSMITRWLKAMNPLHKPVDLDEAERSARSMSLGLVLALAASVPSTLWMFSSNNFAQMMEQQYATMNLTANEVATQQAIMGVVMPYAVGFGVLVTVIIYGALAFAQWRYKTRAIPMIMLGLAIYGLVSSAGMMLLGSMPETGIPMELTALSWAAAVVCGVIYVAALQGALALQAMRNAA